MVFTQALSRRAGHGIRRSRQPRPPHAALRQRRTPAADPAARRLGLIELVAPTVYRWACVTVAPGEASCSIGLRHGRRARALYRRPDGMESRYEQRRAAPSRRVVRNEVMATLHRSPAKLIERACVPEDAPDDIAILTVSLGNAHRCGPTFPRRTRESPRTRVREFIEFLRERAAPDGTFFSAGRAGVRRAARQRRAPRAGAGRNRRLSAEVALGASRDRFGRARSPRRERSSRVRSASADADCSSCSSSRRTCGYCSIGRCGNHIVVTL